MPLASVPLGQGSCTELSPGDATIDLPLYDDCPTNKRVSLVLDSTLVPDGTHQLEVTVTDGAGNATVHDSDLKVVNHPPVTVTPTPIPDPHADRHPDAEARVGREPGRRAHHGRAEGGQAIQDLQGRLVGGRDELPRRWPSRAAASA